MSSQEHAQRDALIHETRALWDSKAVFWDEQFGEGNAFQRELIGPSTERLLAVQPGEAVLDIACGNGAFSRRLAQLGAFVTASDFSTVFIERAQARTMAHPEYAGRITYQVLDATSEAQLLDLGTRQYDAAVASMALMDMPAIAPLVGALAQLLKPGGRFVFSVQHPCFNSNAVSMIAEQDQVTPAVVTTVKVNGYLAVPAGKGGGMPGEPNPHYYFHRPLHALFGTFFHAGFALDGIEEPAFKGDGELLSWRSMSQIPPVLVARMRLPLESTTMPQ